MERPPSSHNFHLCDSTLKGLYTGFPSTELPAQIPTDYPSYIMYTYAIQVLFVKLPGAGQVDGDLPCSAL